MSNLCNCKCSGGACGVGAATATGASCGCSANCNCGCKQGKLCTCNIQHSQASNSARSNAVLPAQQQWQDKKGGCGCKKGK